MPLEIAVGPPQLAVHVNQTAWIADPDGQVRTGSQKGLIFRDTRLISAWRSYADGESWDLLNGGTIDHYAARIYLTNRRDRHRGRRHPAAHPRPRPSAAGSSGGVHEDLDITNNGRAPCAFQPRDRAAQRLRRHVRGQVGPHRAPRPHHHRLVAEPRQSPAHHLPQPRFPPRADLTVRSADPGRCTPTAGSASRSTLDARRRPGTPACSTSSSTASEQLAAPTRLHRATRLVAARAQRLAGWRDEALKITHRQRGILPLLPPGASTTWPRSACRSRRRPAATLAFVPAAGAALVRRPVRPRQPDRLAAERRWSTPSSRAARWTCWATGRPRSATTTATPSPARSCTNCAAASSRISS